MKVQFLVKATNGGRNVDVLCNKESCCNMVFSQFGEHVHEFYQLCDKESCCNMVFSQFGEHVHEFYQLCNKESCCNMVFSQFGEHVHEFYQLSMTLHQITSAEVFTYFCRRCSGLQSRPCQPGSLANHTH